MLASNANFCYSKLLYGTISLTNGSGFEWVSWSHLYSSNYNWMLNSMSAGEKCIDSWLKLLNLLVCSVFKSLLRSKRSCLWCGSITITFSANVKSHIWDKEPNTPLLVATTQADCLDGLYMKADYSIFLSYSVDTMCCVLRILMHHGNTGKIVDEKCYMLQKKLFVETTCLFYWLKIE